MKKRINNGTLRNIQLEVLKEVHDYCVSNNIRYYLTYGSLIGAIRHEGFIPWDDDIDICMPRPDYVKFMMGFNGKKKNLEFTCNEINPSFPYAFGKIQDTRTEFQESSLLNFPIGVSIDVFPIDAVDKEGKLLKEQIKLRALINLKTVVPNNDREWYKNVLLRLSQIVLAPFSLERVVRKMVRNAQRIDYQESDYVASATIGTKLNRPVPKDIFESGVLKKFEQYEFFVPIGYDEYLQSVFGDYMQLPPEEKRVSHHRFEAFFKEDVV